MLRLLSWTVANFLYWKSLRLEKSIGYKLKFKDIPDSWIDGYVLVDMTRTWRNAKIDAQGLNYFTIGAVENGLSSRYDPDSPLYQAWFGGYIVRFKKERDWSAQDHVLLGVADQKKWLSYYGDPNPIMDFNNLDKGEAVTIGGHKTKLYYWSGISHSDVGDRNTWLVKPAMQVMSHFFNKSNPDLETRAFNFVPVWSSELRLEPYAKVTGYGYVAIIDIAAKTKAVLYSGGLLQNKAQQQIMKDLILNHIEVAPVSDSV